MWYVYICGVYDVHIYGMCVTWCIWHVCMEYMCIWYVCDVYDLCIYGMNVMCMMCVCVFMFSLIHGTPHWSKDSFQV